MSRDLLGGWNRQNAHDQYAMATTQSYSIARFDGARRFGRRTVNFNCARFAQLLRHRASRAQATGFEKQIKTHQGQKEKWLKGKRRRGEFTFILFPF